MHQTIIRRPTLSTLLAILGAASPGAIARADAPDAARVLSVMERVADWQLAHLEHFAYIAVAREETRDPRSWQQGAFYIGFTELAERSARRVSAAR